MDTRRIVCSINQGPRFANILQEVASVPGGHWPWYKLLEGVRGFFLEILLRGIKSGLAVRCDLLDK